MKYVDLQFKINDTYVNVDIDTNTVFSLNYGVTDLENPTVSKNTYSNQITIPKTRHNNDIFGQIWDVRSRFNKFNPNLRADFRLHINNNIFETGYVKMEEITKEDYRIRLYGNLGNLFEYLDQIKVNELEMSGYEHTITASSITANNDKYGYALTYQGEYENFDPDLKDTGSEIVDVTWRALSGQEYTDVDLTENKRTESRFAGEYRSYYQKPTVRLQPVFEKIQSIAAKEGFQINLDPDFFKNNPYYENTWLLSNIKDPDDITGGIGFILKEFGDSKRAGSLYINENEALDSINLATGAKLKDTSYISPNKNATINTVTQISTPIDAEAGDTIDVNLYMKCIATFHDDANHKKSKYRNKDLPLNTGIGLYRVNSSTSYTLVSTINYSKVVSKDNLTSGRIFDGTTTSEKHGPTNDFFGPSNLCFDLPGTDIRIPDAGTVWRYNASMRVSGKGTYVIGFVASGNTYFRRASVSYSDRQYGVAFRIESGGIIHRKAAAKTENDGRTGSKRYFSDLISGDITCAQLLLSFTKIFGLMYKINPSTGTIDILQRTNFYTDEIIDWTNAVDRSKEFKITPTHLSFRKGVFKYNDLGTKYEKLYKKTLAEKNDDEGREYGSFQANTGYELGDEEYNYLDGIIFDNCVIVSDTSKYYQGRGNGFTDNKQLPHLEDESGSKVDISNVILLFKANNQSVATPAWITDDTAVMESAGTCCWNSASGSLSSNLPFYCKTATFNNEVYSLNFANTHLCYSASEKLMNESPNSTIVPRYWRSYLQDKLNNQSKILECYVRIKPSEVTNNLLSKFVYLDNSLWVIQQIHSFNPLSEAPTKVTLVKIVDKNNYLSFTNVTDEFRLTYAGNTIYDNTIGENPSIVEVSETTTSVTLSIYSDESWTATSGLSISPNKGNAGTTTMTVSLPAGVNTGSVKFSYGTNTVTINIRRNIVRNVTATTTNGTAAYINGQPSPQAITAGQIVELTSTGDTQFLYWSITTGGTTTVNYSTSAVITVTDHVTANAVYAPAGSVILYCDDENTTIEGQAKIDNYWVLTAGESYTFRNTDPDFTGFLFPGETTWFATGSRVVTEQNTYLYAYYNAVLLNITVRNLSPHFFSGDYLYFDESSIDFDLEAGESTSLILEGNTTSEFTFDRYDYHYPVISQTTFPDTGIYDVTIDGHRVGWDGDQEIDAGTGQQTVHATVQGPVDYTLTSGVQISPLSGIGETPVTAIVQGNGGTVTQKIGGFEYSLKINQVVVPAQIGWTEALLQSLDVAVPFDATEYTDMFYRDSYDATLQSGLAAHSDDGNEMSITASFDENPGTTARILTFNVFVRGSSYPLVITQAGNPDAGQKGLTLVDSNGTIIGTYDGSEDTTILIPGLPVYSIIMWGGSRADIPTGWYLCDGSIVNGFKTPSMNNRFPMGGLTNDFAEGGSNSYTIQTEHLPVSPITTTMNGDHSHTTGFDGIPVTEGPDSVALITGGLNVQRTSDNGSHSHTITLNSTGSQTPIDNTPAYVSLMFIIRLE
ncbi:MAG: hypothetical protein LUH10_00430 [Tannerellaceae bacterium]|nr:hypothetical protein [Tannerellaceae bacterium]